VTFDLAGADCASHLALVGLMERIRLRCSLWLRWRVPGLRMPLVVFDYYVPGEDRSLVLLVATLGTSLGAVCSYVVRCRKILIYTV
jgi:hypothetical protein